MNYQNYQRSPKSPHRSLNNSYEERNAVKCHESQEEDESDEGQSIQTNCFTDSSSFNSSSNKSTSTIGDKSRYSIEFNSITYNPRPVSTPQCPRKDLHQQNSNFKLYIVILAILSIVISYFLANQGYFSSTSSCHFADEAHKYPQLDRNILDTLKTGVETILNKKFRSTMVYLILYQEQTKNDVHDVKMTQTIIKDFVQRSASCFNNNIRPAVMHSADFATESVKKDFGNAINVYLTKMESTNVIIINDLHNISGESARALHSICDTYSPLLKKEAIIFLTLAVPKRDINDENSHKIAEDLLASLWGPTIFRNELDPLISRVTDQIIDLRNSYT